jgi:hypothetical protein
MGAYGLGSCGSRQEPLAGFHGDSNEFSFSVNNGEFIDRLRNY